MTGVEAASITSVRARVQALMAGEIASGAPRHIVVLAIDGVPASLARPMWRAAAVTTLTSVFPTTSSAAWLSSLTGMAVARHGIPGAVFKTDEGQLINIFTHTAPVPTPAVDNLFSDAAACGYLPVAPAGDWDGVAPAWLDTLLRGALRVPSPPFFSAAAAPGGAGVASTILGTVLACCARADAGQPALVWCFIEADHHIHYHGYDADMHAFLATLDTLADRIADALDAVVVCHADHGLVPTRHVPDIAAILAALPDTYAAQLGGAGRTRWIYPCARTSDRMRAFLERALPTSVRLHEAGALFGTHGLARRRVGEIVLVASGPDFVTFDGQSYEHGAWDDDERLVPYATWNAR